VTGGHEGTVNFFEVIRANGERVRGARVTSLPLAAGDLVRVVTGNGGGWGNPRERERDLVRGDIHDGYISEATAREVYGCDGAGQRRES
jgi:N-methylhydantoinase B